MFQCVYSKTLTLTTDRQFFHGNCQATYFVVFSSNVESPENSLHLVLSSSVVWVYQMGIWLDE